MNFHSPLIASLFSLSLISQASANDSSYYASGNQIIPIQETDISIKKEVLTIKRIDGDKVHITVDYTFHNPGDEKTILMGFEAGPPSGDSSQSPVNGHHPYIENFSVNFNGKKLPHKVSFFDQDDQKLENKIALYNIEDLKKEQPPQAKVIESDPLAVHTEIQFFFVYHFPATFPKGDSNVVHTYDYAISGSVFTQDQIEYLLTPALRWANKQIDDFTLNIDLGELQQYHISPSFFDNAEQWTTHGRVKIGMEDVTFQYTGESSKFLTVWQHRGSVTFHAKNFKPSGELSLFSNTYLPAPESRVYDAKKLKINYGSLPSFGEFRLKDAFTRKVLENLPYARRGYIFKNKELKAFYEKQPWYMPDPDYKEASLTEEEKTWLKEVRALKVAN